MPQSKSVLEILAGVKRTFSRAQFEEVVEGRRWQFLKVADKISLRSFGLTALNAHLADGKGGQSEVSHTIYEDNPSLDDSEDCLDLSAQGVFMEVKWKPMGNGNQHFGWGITRKGKWVKTMYVDEYTEYPDKCLFCYQKVTHVSIQVATLSALVDYLVPYQSGGGYESALLGIWFGMQEFMEQTLAESQARVAALCEIVQQQKTTASIPR